MSASVCVVGSCNTDQITVCKEFPKAGETLHGTAYHTGCGGKGANQAVQAARLFGTPASGAAKSSVAFVGKVGKDSMGDAFIGAFETAGVDAQHVSVSSECVTGVATILVDSHGENEIVIVSGANDQVTVAEVDAARLVIENSKVVLTQNEITDVATLQAMRIGKDKAEANATAGVFGGAVADGSDVKLPCPLVIWNAAPAPLTVDKDMLKACHVLCVNETEAASMSGVPADSPEGCIAAAKALMGMGVTYVLLTLGERGSLLIYPTAGDSVGQVSAPAVPVTPIDTTGAGDSFLGSFAHFFASGHSVETAMARANKVASVSVQGRGTQSSYPHRADLKDLFA